jgi:RimJ/RimL family protein N-acetyltransferase
LARIPGVYISFTMIGDGDMGRHSHIRASVREMPNGKQYRPDGSGSTPASQMLIGRTVSLGPLVPDDFGPLFCWANDVAAAKLDFSYRPVDLIAHKQWCENVGHDNSKVVFAIRKINTTPIIGYVQIININSVHRSADLGLRIGAEVNRGNGFGKEALQLALGYCWNCLNLNRVQLIVFKHNERAIRAYRAVGFKREGILRKAAFIDGAWIDLVIMGCLRPNPRVRAAAVKVQQTVEPAA